MLVPTHISTTCFFWKKKGDLQISFPRHFKFEITDVAPSHIQKKPSPSKNKHLFPLQLITTPHEIYNIEAMDDATPSNFVDLEEKMLCPCSHCKYQVVRRRRICNDHTKKWGIFPVEQLEHLISGSARFNNDEPVDIRPERGRPTRVVTNEVIQEDEEHEELEEILEHDMDDMMHALIDGTEDRGLAHEGVEEMRRRMENASQEEKELRRLARLPLYHGAHISVLRACLSILNLQSIFGWSDTSVSKLFA